MIYLKFDRGTFNDLRYVVRSLIASPWLTSGALGTFVLGVGLNVAVFAIVDRVLFRPLPFGDGDRLVTVRSMDAKKRQPLFTFPRLLAVEARHRVNAVEDVAYAGRSRVLFPDGPHTEPLRLVEASYNVLQVLRVTPTFGRLFVREDVADTANICLLREDVWRRRFGADRGIVGRRFTDPDAGIIEIVGLLPPNFIIPSVNWTTASDGLVLARDLLDTAMPTEAVPAPFGRLRHGASVHQAQEQFNALFASIQRDAATSTTSIVVEPMQQGLFWNCRIPLAILFVGASLVWLIACTNVGCLLAARAQSQERQMAIRAALGAPRARLVLMVLAESVVLSSAGCALALLAMAWSMRAIQSFVPVFFQPLVIASVDIRLMGFVVLGAIAGSVLAALYPAWCVVRVDAASLVATGLNRHRARSVRSSLVILESAVGTALVLAGSLAIRSFVGLLETDLGFDPTDLYSLTVRIRNPTARVLPSTIGAALDSLRAAPGVGGVSVVDVPVSSGETPRTLQDVGGHVLRWRQVWDDYFAVMQTPLLAGRHFTAVEAEHSAKVAIINASGLRAVYGSSPAEKLLGTPFLVKGEPPLLLVGVVADTRDRQERPAQPELFTPINPDGLDNVTFVARRLKGTRLDLEDARRILSAHGVSNVTVSSMMSQLEPWLQNPRLYAGLFGMFGIVALVLCAVGLFAVVSFDVALRRSEIGIRLALGASERQISKMLLKDATRPVAVGVAIGSLSSFWAATAFQALLHEISARDGTMYLFVACVLLGIGALSAWQPVRRVKSMSALMTLREQ